MAEVLMVRAVKFVHERGILCAELVPAGNFAHESGILCAEFHLGKRLALAC